MKVQVLTWKEEIVIYGGIKQIWLIVTSQKRRKNDLEKLEKKVKQVKQDEEKSQKFLKQLQKEEFEHPQSARYKLRAINKKLRFFKIAEIELLEENFNKIKKNNLY